MCLGQRLEIQMAETADRRVSSPRVVEALNVVEHVGAGLVAGAVDAAAYPLGFQYEKKLSIAALFHTLPDRLIKQVTPSSATRR